MISVDEYIDKQKMQNNFNKLELYYLTDNLDLSVIYNYTTLSKKFGIRSEFVSDYEETFNKLKRYKQEV